MDEYFHWIMIKKQQSIFVKVRNWILRAQKRNERGNEKKARG